MSNWGRLGVFDLETTGVNVDTSRIVSACIAVLDENGDVIARWDWLADPGVEIPAGAAAVHGITTERAQAEGREAVLVIAEIAQTLRLIFGLGMPVVVYNAPYDLSLLDRECRRHGIEPLLSPSPVIDPLVMDKAVDKYRKGKRTLEVTAERYGVSLDDAHDAGADAVAAGRVAQSLARAYPEELDRPATELHELQAGWHEEQALSFQEYIRRVKGDESYVAESGWPVRISGDPGSFVDTQPIPRPEPRPSLTVPGLYGTGTLSLEALQAPRSAYHTAPPPSFSLPAPPKHAELEQPSPVIEPVEIDSPVIEPVEIGAPVIEPVEIGAPVIEPVEIDSPLIEPVEIDPPVIEPVEIDIELTQRIELVDLYEIDIDIAPEPEPEIEPEPASERDTPSPVQNSAIITPIRRPTVLRVTAGIIIDREGRTLLVRKAGTSAFMQAGGKIEEGESALDALSRELREEIGLELDFDTTEYIGSFRAVAANEENTVIRAEVFALSASGDFEPRGEIEEIRWIDSSDPEGIELAPLTKDTILPIWEQRRSALF